MELVEKVLVKGVRKPILDKMRVKVELNPLELLIINDT